MFSARLAVDTPSCRRQVVFLPSASGGEWDRVPLPFSLQQGAGLVGARQADLGDWRSISGKRVQQDGAGQLSGQGPLASRRSLAQAAGPPFTCKPKRLRRTLAPASAAPWPCWVTALGGLGLRVAPAAPKTSLLPKGPARLGWLPGCHRPAGMLKVCSDSLHSWEQ